MVRQNSIKPLVLRLSVDTLQPWPAPRRKRMDFTTNYAMSSHVFILGIRFNSRVDTDSQPCGNLRMTLHQQGILSKHLIYIFSNNKIVASGQSGCILDLRVGNSLTMLLLRSETLGTLIFRAPFILPAISL